MDSLFPFLRELNFLVFCLIRKTHVYSSHTKYFKALDILKVLSNTNWGGDRSVFLNLYRSLIRSKLENGSVLYGSARKSLFEMP